MAAFGGGLDRLTSRIRDAARQADIYLVDYLTTLPPEGWTGALPLEPPPAEIASARAGAWTTPSSVTCSTTTTLLRTSAAPVHVVVPGSRTTGTAGTHRRREGGSAGHRHPGHDSIVLAALEKERPVIRAEATALGLTGVVRDCESNAS